MNSKHTNFFNKIFIVIQICTLIICFYVFKLSADYDAYKLIGMIVADENNIDYSSIQIDLKSIGESEYSISEVDNVGKALITNDGKIFIDSLSNIDYIQINTDTLPIGYGVTDKMFFISDDLIFIKLLKIDYVNIKEQTINYYSKNDDELLTNQNEISNNYKIVTSETNIEDCEKNQDSKEEPIRNLNSNYPFNSLLYDSVTIMSNVTGRIFVNVMSNLTTDQENELNQILSCFHNYIVPIYNSLYDKFGVVPYSCVDNNVYCFDVDISYPSVSEGGTTDEYNSSGNYYSYFSFYGSKDYSNQNIEFILAHELTHSFILKSLTTIGKAAAEGMTINEGFSEFFAVYYCFINQSPSYVDESVVSKLSAELNAFIQTEDLNTIYENGFETFNFLVNNSRSCYSFCFLYLTLYDYLMDLFNTNSSDVFFLFIRGLIERINYNYLNSNNFAYYKQFALYDYFNYLNDYNNYSLDYAQLFNVSYDINDLQLLLNKSISFPETYQCIPNSLKQSLCLSTEEEGTNSNPKSVYIDRARFNKYHTHYYANAEKFIVLKNENSLDYETNRFYNLTVRYYTNMRVTLIYENENGQVVNDIFDLSVVNNSTNVLYEKDVFLTAPANTSVYLVINYVNGSDTVLESTYTLSLINDNLFDSDYVNDGYYSRFVINSEIEVSKLIFDSGIYNVNFCSDDLFTIKLINNNGYLMTVTSIYNSILDCYIVDITNYAFSGSYYVECISSYQDQIIDTKIYNTSYFSSFSFDITSVLNQSVYLNTLNFYITSCISTIYNFKISTDGNSQFNSFCVYKNNSLINKFYEPLPNTTAQFNYYDGNAYLISNNIYNVRCEVLSGIQEFSFSFKCEAINDFINIGNSYYTSVVGTNKQDIVIPFTAVSTGNYRFIVSYEGSMVNSSYIYLLGVVSNALCYLNQTSLTPNISTGYFDFTLYNGDCVYFVITKQDINKLLYLEVYINE